MAGMREAVKCGDIEPGDAILEARLSGDVDSQPFVAWCQRRLGKGLTAEVAKAQFEAKSQKKE